MTLGALRRWWQPGLWRHRDFLRLWLGQTISLLGSGFGALELTAVLILQATPVQMGILATLGGAPILLIGLQAGVWVDRLRRRPILIVADVLRAVLLLSVPAVWFWGTLHIEYLYIVVFLVGTLSVFFEIAHQALLPSLVQKEQLLEGNAKLEAGSNIAEIVAPGAGGLFVQILSAPIAVFLDALTFLLSAFFLLKIDAPESAPPPVEQRQHMLHDIREGFQIIFGNPVLRALSGSLALSRLFGSFYGAVYTIYLIRTLHLSPALMGLTVGAGGAGALVGSVLCDRFIKRWPIGRVLLGTAVACVVISPLIPLAGGPPLVAFGIVMIAQFIGDFAGSIYAISERSLRQMAVPGNLLGRANTTAHVLVGGMSTVGMLSGGMLGQMIGLRPTVWLTTLGSVFALVWLYLSPVGKLTDYDLQANG